jgi:hypothetical protein
MARRLFPLASPAILAGRNHYIVNSFTISFHVGAVCTVAIGAVVMGCSRFKLAAPITGHHLGPFGKADKFVAIGFGDRLPMPGCVPSTEAFFVFFKLANLLVEKVAGASRLTGRKKTTVITGYFMGHE